MNVESLPERGASTQPALSGLLLIAIRTVDREGLYERESERDRRHWAGVVPTTRRKVRIRDGAAAKPQATAISVKAMLE